MENAQLLIPMAEISGVFIGFGALIAVRSGGAMPVHEINNLRWVVTSAIWVAIAALAPIVIGSYGVGGHALWVVCSLVAIAVLAVVILVFARTPENRAELASAVASQSPAEIARWAVPAFWLPMTAVVVALVLAVFGAFPNQEHALYLTAVGMGLLMSALGLLATVFEQPGSSTAPGTTRPRAGRRGATPATVEDWRSEGTRASRPRR